MPFTEKISPKIELLAPVGTMEALRAAVQNGADAVYLGGKQFSARQYAHNFDDEQMGEVVKYAHLHGVRVYIAVNTLVQNGEFGELLAYLYTLYRLNVDAIIVQDLGAADAVHCLFPQMELHASTQMTIHNSRGVRFLEKMGFTRVILAREVSLHNIELIGEASNLPLEVFVHGALCVSYSGQCLMSSMIGGRSGNRGRCAQPCRLPYTLVNEAGKEIYSGHLLSLRDLNMVEHLPLLAGAGVVSMKVEGRMKRPEYVATVIRHYRRALDEIDSSRPLINGKEEEKQRWDLNETQKELAQVFNRDFTTGYFFEKPGQHLMSYQRPNNRGLFIGRVVEFNARTREVTVKLDEPLQVGDGYEIWVSKGGRSAGEIRSMQKDGKMIERANSGELSFQINEGRPGSGDRVFKTLDSELMEKARSTFLLPQGVRKFPLVFDLKVRLGEPVRLAAEDEQGNRVEVTGQYIVEYARKHSLTKADAVKQLDRLGNTVFYLRELSFDAEEGMMVPASELNNLRRQAVERIEGFRLESFKKGELSSKDYQQRVDKWMIPALEKRVIPPEKKPIISVLVGDMASLRAALDAGAGIVYLGGETLRSKEGIRPDHFRDAVKLCHDHGAQAVLQLPRIFYEEYSAQIKSYCEKGWEAGVDGYLAGNLSALQLAQELDLKGLRADYTLNIFNDYTVRALYNFGVEQMTLSPELTLEQLNSFRFFEKVDMESMVHGKMPLMITEHCAVGNILVKGNIKRGCPQPCIKERYGLKDRMKMVFPVECDENCRMHVYNPKTLNMLDRLPGLLKSGISILRIEARREEDYWVKKVVGIYCREIRACLEEGTNYRAMEEARRILAELSPEGFTTGHYYRGV